jgi:integrase
VPRLTHKHPSYRLHKPSGRAVVTLDGQLFYLGRFNSPESRAEYDRLIAEWLANGRRLASPADAPADLTVSELIARYWADKERQYRRHDGTHGSELEKIRLSLRPLRRLYGPTLARAFGADALETVQRAMIDGGLCCRTVNQRVTRIRGLFLYAKQKKLVPADVYHEIRDVAGITPDRFSARPSKVIKPAPAAHVEAVRPFLSRQLWAVVELQRLTGMRSAEALGVRTGDIDMSGAVWVYTAAKHKGLWRGKERRIFLGPKAQAILKPWLRADPVEFLFQPREAIEEHRAARKRGRKTPLTPSQRARTRAAEPRRAPGDRYDSRAYARAIAKVCDRAGVPRWHAHQLRHAVGTSLRSLFGPDTAPAVLGHSDLNTTAIYAQLDDAKAIAAMERVG